MYNLNVCRLYDLAAVPNSIHGPWPEGQDPGWPSQAQPCPCLSNDTIITIGNTTSFFRDFAGVNLTADLNYAIENSLENFGGSCYVVAKGSPDCYDYPQECARPYHY